MEAMDGVKHGVIRWLIVCMAVMMLVGLTMGGQVSGANAASLIYSPPGDLVGWIVPAQANEMVTPTPEPTPTVSTPEAKPSEEKSPDNANAGNSQSTIGSGSTLQSVSFYQQNNDTTLNILANGPITKVEFTKLTNPSRLAVDLTGVQMGSVPERVTANTTLADQVRVGAYGENTVRLVVDLKGSCTHDYTLSPDKKTLQVSLTPPGPGRSLAGSTVVIDPGHGGSAEPGAIGPTGLIEKDVNLDVALRTAEYLRQKGANVVMTRDSDVYMDLYPRPEIANQLNAAVFVSIHMNSATISSAHGTSTYYVRPDKVYNGSEHLLNEGISLAEKVQKSLLSGLGLYDRGVLNDNFAVLRGAQMPAILVEVAFISNAREESLMKTDTFKDNAARAIAEGVAAYFEQ